MKKKMAGEQEKEVLVNSLWEAAYLVYQDISFQNTAMNNGRIVFIFPDRPEVQELLQKFIRNPPVKIQEYISIFQRLKSLVYAEKGKRHDAD
jgi:hypothetical protein